ncbi:MAG: hypothetical protein ACR2G6_04365 [Gemmatimonadaceae bacterium]
MFILSLFRAALAGLALCLCATAAGAQARNVAGGEVAKPAPAKSNEISLYREVYAYSAEGRRDPFLSLMSSEELRPMISDLQLVVVLFDRGGDSRAVLRDLNTKEQYNAKVGQTLGRMRVSRITPKSVTFTILEFGESRQETLALNDSTYARKP